MDAELIDEDQGSYVIDYPFSFIADTLLLPVYLCTHPAVPHDLLAGWKSIGKIDFRHLDQTHVQIEKCPCDKVISDDVQKYLNNLPITGKGSDRASYNHFIREITVFEDGTGRHAVKIEINSSDSYSTCFLIYDKSNVRIKAKRYRLAMAPEVYDAMV
jgi:hypothetical protein